MENTYTIMPNRGHYELYVNGKLYCCTDTEAEAEREIAECTRETLKICDCCGTELEPLEADDSYVRTYICPHCANTTITRAAKENTMPKI